MATKYTKEQLTMRGKLNNALNQLSRDPAEPFEVLHYDGTKLGKAQDFSTAMILHLNALRKDKKRPELHAVYAGVSEHEDSYGQPLFFLDGVAP